MAFKNRVRLPMKVTRPQFPEERVNFRKADGTTKTLSVVVRKEYEGETDYLPEGWHEKLKIALAHDTITIEGDRYIGDISQTGEYTIEWPDFLDYPTGKAKFKAEVTPFNETNSNCMTCEEATQLELTDDTITGMYGADLQEGETYEWNVAENDNICCYPATFSIVWLNTDYLTGYSISDAGVVTITLGTDLVSVNGLKLATYRVTCPNGNYDEADIYANVEGSTEGCLAPTNLQSSIVSPTEIEYSWDEPFANGTYYYELYEGTGPIGSPLQSGLVDIQTSISLSGLDPNTQYYFRVRTVCYGSESNYITSDTTTPIQGDTCGEYIVSVDDFTGNPSNWYTCKYRNCSGELATTIIFNQNSATICALQTTPSVPVTLVCPYAEVSYQGLC